MRAIFRLVGFGEDRLISQADIEDVFSEETIDQLTTGKLIDTELPFVDVVIHIASDRPIDAFIEDLEDHRFIKAIAVFDISDPFVNTPVHFSPSLSQSVTKDVVEEYFGRQAALAEASLQDYFLE